MHEIKVFENGPLGVEVRSLRKDGQTWLVLMDVARVFGYRDSGRVLHLLRESQYIQADEDIKEDLGVRGRTPYLVNEGGFYRLALSSNRPEAEPFQIWVEDEVLPTLRRGYEAGIDVLEETRARVAELEKRNERLEVAAKEADEYAVGVYNTMVRYQKETDRENRFQKEEWEKAKDFWANAYMAMREEAGRICEEYGISEDRLPIV